MNYRYIMHFVIFLFFDNDVIEIVFSIYAVMNCRYIIIL